MLRLAMNDMQIELSHLKKGSEKSEQKTRSKNLSSIHKCTGAVSGGKRTSVVCSREDGQRCLFYPSRH